MGFFSKVSKAFKKVIKVATGGLIGGHHNYSQATTKAPAPELGLWMQIRLTLLNQNQRSNS